MAAKQRLEQIRLQIEKLGRDSLDVVANANRIVLQGIQRLAEQEQAPQPEERELLLVLRNLVHARHVVASAGAAG